MPEPSPHWTAEPVTWLLSGISVLFVTLVGGAKYVVKNLVERIAELAQQNTGLHGDLKESHAEVGRVRGELSSANAELARLREEAARADPDE